MHDLFSFDESDEDSSMDSSRDSFSDLDDCIDTALEPESFSLAKLIHGHENPAKRQKTVDF